jgi:hypothetical protein
MPSPAQLCRIGRNVLIRFLMLRVCRDRLSDRGEPLGWHEIIMKTVGMYLVRQTCSRSTSPLNFLRISTKFPVNVTLVQFSFHVRTLSQSHTSNCTIPERLSTEVNMFHNQGSECGIFLKCRVPPSFMSNRTGSVPQDLK